MTNILGDPLAVQPDGPERGSQFDGRRLDNFVADPLTVLDTAELHDHIERLGGFVRDLHMRKERRAAMLDTPAGAPQSDPVYQRLFFTHERFSRQIEGARRELSRRKNA